jgi:adenine-specific DNA-methyltransferase
LLECLDKNHLYVNYSEIDDEEYGVSKEDKKINKEFYSK